MNRYQKSECQGGYLHDYLLVKEYRQGVLERCSRCGDSQFFEHDTPDWKYLEFHIRSALQRSDPRFSREYPNFGK